MSGDTFPLVWRTPWPSVYHFAVAMCIARYQDRQGVCRLKQKTIARMLGCSVRQVGKVLDDMKKTDPPQIEVVETRRRDGSQGTNLVRLKLQAHVRSDDDPLVTADDFYLEYGAEQLAPGAVSKSGDVQAGAAPGADDVPNTVPTNRKASSLKASSEQLVTPSATDTALRAFEAYNLLAKRLGLSFAEALTETRKKKLLKRIEESGVEGWNRVLQNVEKSKFLCGETRAKDGREPFRASLDFLLQASSFQKVLEGQYGHDRRVSVGDDAAQAEAFQARMLGDRAFMLNLVTRWTQDAASWPALAGPAPGAPGCLIPGEIVARVTGEGPTGADALAMALQAHAPRAQVVTDDADLIE